MEEELSPNTGAIMIMFDKNGILNSKMKLNVDKTDTMVLRMMLSEMQVISIHIANEIQQRAAVRVETGKDTGDSQ